MLVPFPRSAVRLEDDYAQMEGDFALDRKVLARKLFDGSLTTWEQTNISNPFAPDLSSQRCALCLGAFPGDYRVRQFWGITTDAVQSVHRGCYAESEAWSK